MFFFWLLPFDSASPVQHNSAIAHITALQRHRWLLHCDVLSDDVVVVVPVAWLLSAAPDQSTLTRAAEHAVACCMYGLSARHHHQRQQQQQKGECERKRSKACWSCLATARISENEKKTTEWTKLGTECEQRAESFNCCWCSDIHHRCWRCVSGRMQHVMRKRGSAIKLHLDWNLRIADLI